MKKKLRKTTHVLKKEEEVMVASVQAVEDSRPKAVNIIIAVFTGHQC